MQERKSKNQISLLCLQCGRHQIPNPQGLPFDLSIMSWHYLLELCWLAGRGPRRKHFKKCIYFSKLFAARRVPLVSVKTMQDIPEALKALFGNLVEGFPPTWHIQQAQCQRLSEQYPILQGAWSSALQKPRLVCHCPFLQSMCSSK